MAVVRPARRWRPPRDRRPDMVRGEHLRSPSRPTSLADRWPCQQRGPRPLHDARPAILLRVSRATAGPVPVPRCPSPRWPTCTEARGGPGRFPAEPLSRHLGLAHGSPAQGSTAGLPTGGLWSFRDPATRSRFAGSLPRLPCPNAVLVGGQRRRAFHHLSAMNLTGGWFSGWFRGAFGHVIGAGPEWRWRRRHPLLRHHVQEFL